MGAPAVKVRVVGQRVSRKVRISKKTSVADLLEKLGLNRETVVTRLNGKIVAEEERLAGGDLIEILHVVTGG